MPGDNLPPWAVRWVMGGSAALGTSLVAVLCWVVLGLASRIEANEVGKFEARQASSLQNQRMEIVERDLSRMRDLLEKIAEKQGITITP
jgi:hypothetical protein